MLSRRDALLTGTAAAAALAMGSPRAWGRVFGAGQPEGEAQGTFFPWKELGEGVHAIVDFETGGNTLLVVNSGEAMLVDTKYPAIGRALRREAEAMGVRVTHAVNTHHHGDHTGGNFAFTGSGCQLVTHQKTEPRLLKNFGNYRGSVAGGPRFVGGLRRPTQELVLEEAGSLTLELKDLDASDWATTRTMPGNEMEIEVGSSVAQLTHFGDNAHTDNDVVVHVPSANVLHTGDLVFSGMHPYFDPSAGVNARGWIDTLRKTHALCDADTVVLPGHGDVGDRSVIDKQISYLEQLIDAVQAEIDAGVSKEEAAAKSWAFMDGLGFEQIRPRAIAAVYDELSA